MDSCPTAASYDDQATTYNARAGLGLEVSHAVAEAVWRAAEAGPHSAFLEIGTGTGEIGSLLCRRPWRYVGFDLSAAMLARWPEQLRRRSTAQLLRADGNAHWPIADRSIDVVFGSRALHLIPVTHIVRELHRIGTAGNWQLLVGRVTRDKGSVRSRMRRQMRALLVDRGLQPRDGQDHREQLVSRCLDVGGERIEATVAASWTVRRSPARVLSAWRGKSGLGGLEVADEVRLDVLDQMERWSLANLGDLDKVEESVEQYWIAGARFAGAVE